MIGELNYSYYGIPSGRELSADWNNDLKLGKIINRTIYDNYYEWENIPVASKVYLPLDTSVYLWHLPANATFACNSMYNIPVSNTLNIDIATNKESNNVPFSVAAVVVDSGLLSSAGFRPSPHLRLAWNTNYNLVYSQSELTYDIPYIKYCVGCGVGILNYESTPAVTGVQVNGIHTYIDNHPTAEVTYLRCDLYAGENGDRRLDRVSAPQGDSSTYSGSQTHLYRKRMSFDILSHKPICDSATGIRNYLQEGHSSWVNDKFYMPFAYRYKSNIGNNQSTTNMDYQHIIGLNQYYNYSALRSGATTGYGALTAQCFRFNSDRHDFDDVSYHWALVWFDDANKIELENGFDITNMSGGGRIMTKLVIDDYKGQSRGIALERAVKHELAYLGFYFTDTITAAGTAILGSTGTGAGVYLPEKIGGVTTGRYFTGDDIKNVPYADAESVKDFVYKPEDIDEDGGDLITNHYTATIGGSTNLYCFSASEFEGLMKWLNTTYSPTNETQFIQDFKGENPGDYIVSIKYFPFDLPYSGSAPVPVYVGKLDTGLLRVPLSKQIGGNSLYDFGSFAIVPPYVYDDFRIQYCKMLLYIPWCGYTELDPVIFAKSPDGTYHSMNVKLHIDYTTGSCMGLVYRDSQLIQTINGTCGIDIPLSALNQGSYQNAIKQAEIALSQAENARIMSFLGLAGSIATTIGSGLTGNLPGLGLGVMGMIGSVGTIDNAYNKVNAAQYSLEHTAVSVGQISGASPLNNAYMDQQPTLYIYKPSMLDGFEPSIYGHTIGYACNRNGLLKNFSGLTIAASWDLSGIDCTAEEKTIISEYLAGGVIV